MNEPSSVPDEWFDRQYDPRLPDRPMPVILAEWHRRSAAFTAGTTVRREQFAYGDGPRETVDVYRAVAPRGFLLFFHGGYWMACSKDEHAWIASSFVEAGISVAVVNYPLCPAATVGEITEAARRVFAFLDRAAMTEAERACVVVSGHSAGGYLAAALLATDWRAYGLRGEPPVRALSISGLFDLAPLVRTSMNAVIGLRAEDAAELSLTDKLPLVGARLVLGVGGLESGEFQRQSAEMVRCWPGAAMEVIRVAGRNHFDVLDDFADRDGRLHAAMLELFA